MQSIRQLKAGAKLVIETIPIPQPGPGEVLVKMQASPINPSDLTLLQGNYLTRNYPFTPGLEGSGVVVKSGGGILAGLRVGKRVACSPNPEGDGAWAEYMKTSAMRTIVLPKDLSFEQGATLVVNPMTVMALIHIAKEGKHQAMVNNAAASSLGKMLIRITNRYRIPLINIVRKGEQISELKKLGATHVLNSEDPDFEKKLQQLSSELGATLVLDAVTGLQTSILLKAAPRGSTLITYARLSGDPMEIDPGSLIKEEKQIIGFQLGDWLSDKGLLFKLRFIGKVKKHLPEALSTHIHKVLPLEDAEKAIKLYKTKMSDGKYILSPEKNAPSESST